MDKLKVHLLQHKLQIKTHLHSNMDKLKELRNWCVIWFVFNLHSNMDKLKVTNYCFAYCCVNNLHSNMDKLKDDYDSLEKKLLGIYIPIWIN